jgi:hypothetical protein
VPWFNVYNNSSREVEFVKKVEKSIYNRARKQTLEGIDHLLNKLFPLVA